ncbi:antA/AntB antirepressor family protein [Acetivibrio sp. MSJd-27]|uniref:antA/AntB antirepressor family protein n=1 Tax=Acetivibrio sp. MSJd-27 TaxID=2841523 RepID=UPI001C10C786|nr:antA/AntB antirepressor family protein [Acetivibrio sp. MSJd-27]MBU5451402.1 antA/AntB antirepressor family protein [Acetivibrio sp. MSJd-27]
MNELKIFNQEVIPVYETEEGNKVVLGRELHENLNIVSKYADWIKNMILYGFDENKDYSTFSKNLENGGRTIEHVLTLDMAKHIAMIQRTPQGFAIRQKLIELEKMVNKPLPMSQAEILAAQAQLLVDIEKKQREQDKAIEKVDKCLDGICDIVKLDTTSWREESRKLITKIAKSMGGVQYIRDVQTEIYKLVELRGSVNLSIRLTNKRRRMADEGVCKSKRDKLNYLDIIAEDKKLIEIYTAITKEMAVKYGAFYENAV